MSRNIEKCRKYLSKIPGAIQGNGGRAQTWTAMIAIAGFDIGESDAWEIAQEYNTRCLPPWPEKDLKKMLTDAFKSKLAGRFTGGKRDNFKMNTKPAKPMLPAERPQPMRLPEVDICPADIILKLFAPHETMRVVLKAAKKDDKWQPANIGEFISAEKLAEKIKCQVLNENTEAGAWMGINPQKDTKGNAESVESFRYMLIEGDTLSREQQFACISKTGLPISVVIDSGGKSLHAWVRLDAETKEEWTRRAAIVRNIAIPLGFDEATMKNPGQLCRLPGARRGDNIQRVVAINLGAKNWEEWEHNNPPQPEPEEVWPFLCLGNDATHCWFLPLDTKRPVSIQMSDLTNRGKLMGLHTNEGWWLSMFPKGDNQINYAGAAAVLRDRCVKKGYWDVTKEAEMCRGRGLWKDGGNLVFNSGRTDQLLIDGMPAPAGWVSPTGKQYLGGGTLQIADDALSDEQAQDFLGLMREQLGSDDAATIAAGWVFNALSIGTVELRAHLYFTGDKGAGKSHVLKLIESACGSFMIKASAGTTEAGLRHELGAAYDALPFSYDEAEGDTEEGRKRQQAIHEMLRLSGEGEGQIVRKGTPGGATRGYKLQTAGLFASIHSTLSRDRDRSRFAVINIKTVSGEAERRRNRETAKLYASTLAMPGFASKLARRAIMLAPTRMSNAAMLKTALSQKFEDERSRKLWAELLAGAVAMKHSRQLTMEEAEEIARGFDPQPFTGMQDNEAVALLTRLLTSVIPNADGHRRTLGELLVDVSKAGNNIQASRDALGRVGVFWDQGKGVRFGYTHAELTSLVKDEPWLGDSCRIREILRQLPGATYLKSARVGAGHKGPAVLVPAEVLAGHLEDLNVSDPF